ncbi:hypothetical protein U1Q18_034705 [Sarracenia purpurea var. burkii]
MGANVIRRSIPEIIEWISENMLQREAARRGCGEQTVHHLQNKWAGARVLLTSSPRLPAAKMADSVYEPLRSYDDDGDEQPEDAAAANSRTETTRIASLDVFRGLSVFVNLLSKLR